MTSHNEAQDGITLELKNNVKATLYTGLKLEKRHIDMIGEALDLKHEAQKTNEDLISEGHKRIEETAEKICDCGLHEEIGDVFKEILENALTLKDEAHRKEMEEAREEYKEYLQYHYEHFGIESVKELLALTPTKEVTEELLEKVKEDWDEQAEKLTN